MRNSCWWEAQGGERGVAVEEPRGGPSPSPMIPPGPAALPAIHDTTHTIRREAGGRKNPVVLEIGQQKARNRRAGESKGALAALPTPYFLSRFPAKSV